MKLIFSFLFVFLLHQAQAQLCTDPVNTIYGITNSGNLHRLTVNTGLIGIQINLPYIGNAPANPNGLGYNNSNGRFYYFKRSPGSAPQEFVSYDPALNTVTVLANCPSTYAVYVGCVTPNGLGYYCWDSRANIYYYSIAANTWTFITNTIVDNTGKDVDSVIRAHGSGDIAIDGMGNLLMLPSSNSRYALFRLNAPLPTSAVASLSVTQLVPLTNPPGKFVGIALNASGQIIMCTASPFNRLYRLENDLSLTLLSIMVTDMADLTSCNYPFGILPVSFKNFSSVVKSNGVLLSWDMTEQAGAASFAIERSTNSVDWKQIGTVKQTSNALSGSFVDASPLTGKNYYRIRLINLAGGDKYSQISKVEVNTSISFAVWPNPVVDKLQITNNNATNAPATAVIFDQSGRAVKSLKLKTGLNSIAFEDVVPGFYTVSVVLQGEQKMNYKIVRR